MDYMYAYTAMLSPLNIVDFLEQVKEFQSLACIVVLCPHHHVQCTTESAKQSKSNTFGVMEAKRKQTSLRFHSLCSVFTLAIRDFKAFPCPRWLQKLETNSPIYHSLRLDFPADGPTLISVTTTLVLQWFFHSFPQCLPTKVCFSLKSRVLQI